MLHPGTWQEPRLLWSPLQVRPRLPHSPTDCCAQPCFSRCLVGVAHGRRPRCPARGRPPRTRTREPSALRPRASGKGLHMRPLLVSGALREPEAASWATGGPGSMCGGREIISKRPPRARKRKWGRRGRVAPEATRVVRVLARIHTEAPWPPIGLHCRRLSRLLLPREPGGANSECT